MSMLIYIGAGLATGLCLLKLYRILSTTKFTCRKVLHGKTFLVTGANSGIGRATVEELAKTGARVILACRDVVGANNVVDNIRQTCSQGELIVKFLDLSSLQSVRDFCHDILKCEKNIHVLINNAGVYGGPYCKSVDGFELNFATNHLGHFLLTNMLLPKLRESAPSRVVVVSSALHKRGTVDFNNLNLTSKYNPGQAYCNSKLMNVMFAHELHKRVFQDGVSVYTLSPGIVRTGLGRRENISKFILYILRPFIWALLLTPIQGCQTTLYCAIEDSLPSGNYYKNCRHLKFAGQDLDDESCRKLWQISEQLTGLVDQ